MPLCEHIYLSMILVSVPAIIPHGLRGSVLSYVYNEPPSFYFQWGVHSKDTHLLHDIAGFIVTCSANKTTDTLNNGISISEPVFIEGVVVDTQNVFSTSLYFPDTCDSNVDEVMTCSVSAFNEQGRGLQSEGVLIDLPCFSGKCCIYGNSTALRYIGSVFSPDIVHIIYVYTCKLLHGAYLKLELKD